MVAFVDAAEAASFSDWGNYQGVAIEVKLIGGQQYKGLYLDLSSVVPGETIADSVSCNFKASPVGSEYVYDQPGSNAKAHQCHSPMVAIYSTI